MNKNKIFYLHIPKTAGSSMNKFLTSQFKEGQTLTHIESKIDFQNNDDVLKADNYELLSGHIQLPQAQHKLKVFETRQIITTFRIPFEHVVSHIAWVRKLGDNGEEKRLQQHNATVQKIVAKLLQTDLSNAEDVLSFIDWLEMEKIYLFHDTQTRYLCGGPAKELLPQHINSAISNLQKIDFVGVTERLGEFMALLCFQNDWKINTSEEIVENKNSNNYGLDIQNPKIREALQKLVKWDNLIYKLARERFIDDMHLFLAQLEKQKWPRFVTVRELMLKNIFKEED